MKIEAILFDLDGTLVDSVPLYMQAYFQTLNVFGLVLSEPEFNEIFWENHKLTNVLTRFNLGHRDAEIRKYRNDLYIRTLAEQVTWFEDAKSFADSCNDKVPRAIVTGSWQSFVDGIQRRVDLSAIASTIITADDCQPYDKPHPHSLLLGAERLGVAPEHCIYVGDQEFDIQAAENAGMAHCLIAREHTPPQAHENAMHVIHSLQELPALLAQM
ncbi:MAG: HAD family phosphatase [Candidatus Peribacteraceae bacterium]|jgi:HAD superfamily hydrolase (TIGR01549 family)|nr:HAD family phosphatase [Candidatus Peribacteraceae bacterium]